MPQVREMKPTWTMDIMILSSLSEIGKYIDDNAMKVKAGNLEFLSDWRAALDQFYTNIKSFLTEDIRTVTNDTFSRIEVDFPIGGRTIPIEMGIVKSIIQKLQILNEMFYQARNELFMRFIEIISPTRKATEYAYSALPTKDREAKVLEAEAKEKKDET